MSLVNLLSIIMLGFFLGMRHATDPDHVVAITTIVSRYRRVSHAALIGSLWGLGHTFTIVAVGGGIILFDWVIPTRIGLSMEFSVALMLILLGIFNLTGIFHWITERFAAGDVHPSNVRSYVHSHNGCLPAHTHRDDVGLHTHEAGETTMNWFDKCFGQIGIYQLARPVVIGLVHGLAGSAAVACRIARATSFRHLTLASVAGMANPCLRCTRKVGGPNELPAVRRAGTGRPKILWRVRHFAAASERACTGSRRRTPPAHRHVLRPGGFHRAGRATRSGGVARSDASLPQGLQ